MDPAHDDIVAVINSIIDRVVDPEFENHDLQVETSDNVDILSAAKLTVCQEFTSENAADIETLSGECHSVVDSAECKTVSEPEQLMDTQDSVEILSINYDSDGASWMQTSETIPNYTSAPSLAAFCSSEFQSCENFLRGCLWSPDGSSLLSNSADNKLRVFNTTQHIISVNTPAAVWKPSVCIPESDLIYDFCWYSCMQADYSQTCCLAASCRDNPIHLWDSETGQLRCTYRAYDQMDELVSAHSLMFSTDGQSLYCGFTKTIRIFDVSRPGRDCISRATYAKGGQTGIISCLAMNPTISTLYAAGSYSRSVAIYTEPRGDMMCMFQGQHGGVTHIKFSPDGNQLFTGGRMDPEILCWDMRNPGEILYILQRQVTTNQRISFDIDSSGRYLMSGNQNGTVSVWDLQASPVPQLDSDPVLPPVATFLAHDNDTVNGLSCHPSLPLVATASGQRHISVSLSGSDSDVEGSGTDEDVNGFDNSLKVWRF